MYYEGEEIGCEVSLLSCVSSMVIQTATTPMTADTTAIEFRNTMPSFCKSMPMISYMNPDDPACVASAVIGTAGIAMNRFQPVLIEGANL